MIECSFGVRGIGDHSDVQVLGIDEMKAIDRILAKGEVELFADDLNLLGIVFTTL